MTGNLDSGSLAELRKQLGALPFSSLREAFEQHPDAAANVELRRLFTPGHSVEVLSEIPLSEFARADPHPYQSLGAPYQGHSPFLIRETVLQRLQLAQNILRAQRPGWSIQLFDAWRPLAVQHYMVDHAFEQLLAERGLLPENLDENQINQLWQEVFTIWARPLDDPALAPPHSTGAAVDLTLLDEDRQPVPMGCAIDAFGPVSRPDHFTESNTEEGQAAHRNRSLLCAIMSTAGFQRHPYEWWHFSYGDQLWALMCWLDEPSVYQTAHYGGLG